MFTKPKLLQMFNPLTILIALNEFCIALQNNLSKFTSSEESGCWEIRSKTHT